MTLDIVKYNVNKNKTKTLKIMNAQLQGLLLWAVPNIVLAYVQRESICEKFVKELIVH